MKERLKRFDRRWWWLVLAFFTALQVTAGTTAMAALFGVLTGLEIAKRFRRPRRNELNFILSEKEAERIRHDLLPWLRGEK